MEPQLATATMPSFWQALGALVAVLALLVLALKVLRRYFGDGSVGANTARLLRVQRLGPRRELQTLRVDEEIYTLYRHDGAMVVLKREDATEEASTPAPVVAASVGRRLLAMAAAAGGRVRSRPNP